MENLDFAEVSLPVNKLPIHAISHISEHTAALLLTCMLREPDDGEKNNILLKDCESEPIIGCE